MSHFKTPKGTVLPFLNLKGKDYLQVMHRLVWFREEHPDWGVITTFYQLTDKFAIAKAEVINEKGQVIATGHKREDVSHFADFSEKAETGAVGRALALCGYGTQFAPELDEEHRVVDSPAPPKKVQAAPTPIRPPVAAAPSQAHHEPLGRPRAFTITEPQAKRLFAISKASQWSQEDLKAFLHEAYGVESSMELNREQYDEVTNTILPNMNYETAVDMLRSRHPSGGTVEQPPAQWEQDDMVL